MLMIPPVLFLQAPTTLPAHVHATLKEAQAGAKASKHGIYAVLTSNEADREQVLAFLGKPEADRVRARCEVWVPEILDPAGARLRKAQVTDPGTAVLLLSADAKEVQGRVQGKEATPVSRAFRIFAEAGYDFDPVHGAMILQPGPWKEDPETGRMTRVVIPQPPPDGVLRDWAGPGIDPKTFQAFLEARKQDLSAGAKEPYRAWLGSLMASGAAPVKAWAATRMVEAEDRVQPGLALDTLLTVWTGDLLRSLGKPQAALPQLPEPPEDAPGIGDLAASAPVWDGFRHWFTSSAPPDVTAGLYALMSHHMGSEDRDAALAVFLANGKRHPDLAPWDTPAFWLATDWLISYGHAQDWPAFEAVESPSWRASLKELQGRLAGIPAYWQGREAAGPVLEIFPNLATPAERASLDAFWNHPSPTFQSWGISRGPLDGAHFGNLRREAFSRAFQAPEAERRGIRGQVIIHMLVDPEGRVRAARAEPRYALGLLAPAALEWVCAGTYKPTAPEDAGKPWVFSEFLKVGHP